MQEMLAHGIINAGIAAIALDLWSLVISVTGSLTDHFIASSLPSITYHQKSNSFVIVGTESLFLLKQSGYIA